MNINQNPGKTKNKKKLANPSSKNIIEILKIRQNLLKRDIERTSKIIEEFERKHADSKVGKYFNGQDSIDIRQQIKDADLGKLTKRNESISFEIKNIETEIKKLGRNYQRIFILYLSPSLFVSFFLIFLVIGGFDYQQIQYEQIKSHYLIQNLKGDTVDTWLSWRLSNDHILNVNIIGGENLSQEKINAIKDAIISDKAIQIDDSLLHKGSKGSTSTYYMGWETALAAVSSDSTLYYVPSKFSVAQSQNEVGDIIIKLTPEKDADGYSGFTKSISDQNQILKSTITIYDVNNLTPSQLGTITRHEFGHALGLAHSSAPEDLMHATIQTEYPYISECDVDAIISLYNGSQNSQVICEK